MRLFIKAPRWNEVYQINGSMSVVRFLLSAAFWLWGIVGFAFVFVQFGDAVHSLRNSGGVGSSSFLAALAVVWIGGMVFFGLGSLLAGSNFNVMQRVAEGDYGDVKVSR